MRSTLIFFVLIALSLVASRVDARQLAPETLPDPTVDLPLDGAALIAVFTDRTHRGYYQYGDWVDRDPAFTERMNADGTTLHDQDGISFPGRWRVRHNVVCFDYEVLNGGCFRIFKKGTCHFAVSAINNEVVAITVLDGETADCEPSFA